MCYVHTMEYYLATKRNEVLIHATAWMHFEKTTLSEKNPPQKATHCVIPYI